MVGMFENILEQCTENGTFTLNKKKYSFLRIIFLYKDRCGDFDVGRCKSYIRSKNIQTCKLGMYYKGPYASEIRNVYYPIKVSRFCSIFVRLLFIMNSMDF